MFLFNRLEHYKAVKSARIYQLEDSIRLDTELCKVVGIRIRKSR